MGISGLLPVLKEIQVHGNISEFKGKRLAVDAYVWLHKGAFGCAEDIVKGKKTTKFVDYAMYRVRLLRHHGIEPYIVFDGGPLPAKKKTEVSREKSRAENLARAIALEGQGRLRDARDLYTKCVDITPEMALQLIKALKAENVDYVVAPYEADAQLCFLEREGYVDGIITEDSDLLVFGCRHVIFKLEGNGQCVSIKAEKLALVNAFPMHGWTDVQFRRMAMLSGCDYLDSIPGIGLKTAHRLLRRHKTVEKVVQMIKLEGTLHVPEGYIQAFAQAELAFIHQRVFDPTLKKLVPLNAFPQGGLKENDEKWVGLDMEPEIARGIAEGILHPETRIAMEDICPDYQPAKRNVQKMPVGSGSKVKIAGPMDAFISRSKAPKIKPLPTPVGQSGPGVSRLSERKANVDVAETLVTKKSKFFSSRRSPIKTKPVQLVWESSQEPIVIDMDEEPETVPLESVQSPASHCASPNHPDPEVEFEESYNHLTSPAAPISSPAVSSPPRGETFTSPRAPRDTLSPRSVSPISPTRLGKQTSAPNILIPSTSQARPHYTPLSSSAPHRLQANAGVLGTSTYSNVDSSSDTLDQEVVTPSFDMGKRGTPSIAGLGRKRSRELEEEVDEVELEERQVRAEKAKVISHDWRLKYAFGANHSPIVRSARPTAPRRNTIINTNTKVNENENDSTPRPRPAMKSRASMPISSTMPRILNVKPINIPVSVSVQETPAPTEKTINGTVLIPSSDLAAPSSSPSGAGGLMKYRFTGKVDTRQMSSPTL